MTLLAHCALRTCAKWVAACAVEDRRHRRKRQNRGQLNVAVSGAVSQLGLVSGSSEHARKKQERQIDISSEYLGGITIPSTVTVRVRLDDPWSISRAKVIATRYMLKWLFPCVFQVRLFKNARGEV